MAIKYPKHLKGVTAGAMREAARTGHSTAGEGLLTAGMARQIISHTQSYFYQSEPAGKFMTHLEQTQKDMENTTEAISKAACKMVDTAKDANETLTKVNGKLRDGTEKLSAALDKLMTVAGRRDFAETVKLTESLVDSLERLAKLEEKGVLDKVMKAMAK